MASESNQKILQHGEIKEIQEDIYKCQERANGALIKN